MKTPGCWLWRHRKEPWAKKCRQPGKSKQMDSLLECQRRSSSADNWHLTSVKLIFRLLIPRVRDEIYEGFRLWIWGYLLQWQQEMNIAVYDQIHAAYPQDRLSEALSCCDVLFPWHVFCHRKKDNERLRS
jgi:hypothetical protein